MTEAKKAKYKARAERDLVAARKKLKDCVPGSTLHSATTAWVEQAEHLLAMIERDIASDLSRAKAAMP